MSNDWLQSKPKLCLTRLLLNWSLMGALFFNPELMQCICGPFTLPLSTKSNLFFYVFWVEAVRVLFQPLAALAARLDWLKWVTRHFLGLLVVKYLIVLMLKFLLIFEDSHRKKFYLHSFLLEGTIILAAVLFDVIQRHNIKEAGELLILQGLHRLSIVYELTQTFCPNLILYYAFSNLLVFVLAQVESQERYGISQSLYVKHDVYRFLFMSVLFFALVAFAQLFTSNFKMMVTFLLCLKFTIGAVRQYSENRFKECANCLVGICAVLAACEVVFIWLPFNVETGYRLEF